MKMFLNDKGWIGWGAVDLYKSKIMTDESIHFNTIFIVIQYYLNMFYKTIYKLVCEVIYDPWCVYEFIHNTVVIQWQGFVIF